MLIFPKFFVVFGVFYTFEIRGTVRSDTYSAVSWNNCQAWLDWSQVSPPVLNLKGLRINEHVGSTIEVCVTAMTIWKSFIVSNHLRMTSVLGLGTATVQTPADFFLMSLLEWIPPPPLLWGHCTLEIQSFHTPEFLSEMEYFSLRRERGRISPETFSAGPFMTAG